MIPDKEAKVGGSRCNAPLHAEALCWLVGLNMLVGFELCEKL